MRRINMFRDGEPEGASDPTPEAGQQDSGGDKDWRAEFERLNKRFAAVTTQKQKLEQAQSEIAQAKAAEASNAEMKRLEEARDYEKARLIAEERATKAESDRDALRAEYETKLLLTRDGITNERVAKLFASELQAIADEDERSARWAEIKADPENAIFFPSPEQAPTGKPTAPTPPGTAAAGRGNTGAEWSKINQIINGRPGTVNPDEMSRALAMVRQYVDQHGTPPPGVILAS